MELANAITQAIGSLGFPIVMCGALFWLLNKREEEHREENLKLSEAIDRMNITLTRLLERMVVDNETDS